MKLLVAIIDDEFTGKVVKALMAERIQTTKLASSGGFLSSGNTTLLIGVEDEQLEDTCDLIRKICRNKKVRSESGDVTIGSNLFIMPIEQYVKI